MTHDMNKITYEFVIEGDGLDPVEVDNVLNRASDYICESLYDCDKEGPTCYFERDAG